MSVSETLFYLVDRRPVRAKSFEEWVEHFSYNDDTRIVAVADTEDFVVSTVFLGIDHRHWGSGPPIVFETMVFARDPYNELVTGEANLDHATIRYSSWDDAEAGHLSMVRRLQMAEARAARVQPEPTRSL